MPSRHAMENDRNSMKYWTMKFGQKQKWGHPLMGWMGGDDTMKQLTEKLRFESLEQAIQFCERNGWKFRVQRPAPEKNPDIDNRYEQTILPKVCAEQTLTRRLNSTIVSTRIWVLVGVVFPLSCRLCPRK